MTLGKFLAGKRRQELRGEFNGNQRVAMAGGTIKHSEIATDPGKALRR